VIEEYKCGKQLAFVEGTQVYIQDRLENITEGFTVVKDNFKFEKDDTVYVILEVNKYSSQSTGIFSFKESKHKIQKNIKKLLESIDANQKVVTKTADSTYKVQGQGGGGGDTAKSTATQSKSEESSHENEETDEKRAFDTAENHLKTVEEPVVKAQIALNNNSNSGSNDVLQAALKNAETENKTKITLAKIRLVEVLRSNIESLSHKKSILEQYSKVPNIDVSDQLKYLRRIAGIKLQESKYASYLMTLEDELEDMNKNQERVGDTFIAVPRSFVHRLDSLNACLIGNDPLGLFRPGEDKDGSKSAIFRKWKNGDKPEKDKKWNDYIPWMGDSKMSNQINYFIYKLFVPINRICCYLQQLSFNKMETLCKVFTILDEAIYLPSMFPSDSKKQHDREMVKLKKIKDGMKSASTNDKQIIELKIIFFETIFTMTSEEKSDLKTKLQNVLGISDDNSKLTSFKNLFKNPGGIKQFYDTSEKLIFTVPTDPSVIKSVLEQVIEKLTETESVMDPLKHILHTFLKFCGIFLYNVTLTIFSILVHYITLLIDIIEVTLTSFLMISSGVTAQEGSVTKIFSGLIGGFSELLKNPAVLAGLGVATSGIGPVIAQGLSMTGSAAAAAINSNNEARMYGEQFKAQGFSNMTGFVAKNPTGVLFFTKSFIKVFFKFGIAGPFTLIHRMTETLCDYTGLSENDVDEEDELGKRAAEIMMKQLNDSIVKGTDDFNSTNKKAMNASWKGITSSANSFITGTKKYIKSLKENSVSSPQEDMSPEPEKIISSKKSPRKPVSRKRSNNGIDKANIISTKRVIKKPSRYGGGRKKTGRKSKKSIHYRKIH
jgi:hypothetical protein